MIKTEPHDSRMGVESSEPHRPQPMNVIKREGIELIDDDIHEIVINESISNDHHMKHARSRTAECDTPMKLSPNGSSSNSDIEMIELHSNNIDIKYCHICNIKFNYHKSFIAHKKFYCRAVTSDMDVTHATGTPSNQSAESHVPRTPETSVI